MLGWGCRFRSLYFFKLPYIYTPHICFRAWYRSNKNKTDAYVSVKLCKSDKTIMKLAETSVKYDDLNPEWEETKNLLACYNGEYIKVSVKDSDTLNKDDYIGSCRISCLSLRDNPFKLIKDTFDLKIDEDEERKTRGTITLSFKYCPFNSVEATTIGRTISTYFPLRPNNKVHLYQ